MEIVFATNNQHKVAEIQAVLLPYGIRLLSLADIHCNEELPETQDTLEGNAVQKARYVLEKYGYACFADDTGLEVEALHDQPGIYSARYAGPQRSAEDNMNKLLSEMDGVSERKACFKTVICYATPVLQHIFEGKIYGEILRHKRGTEGFGYDPVFCPYLDDEQQELSHRTFAEMSLEEKNKLSHRSRAVTALVKFLQQL